MTLKKNGKIAIFLAGCFLIGYISAKNMSKNKSVIIKKNISFDNYINRLSEFDLTHDKLSTELFVGLVNDGLSLKDAFDVTIRASYEYGWIK